MVLHSSKRRSLWPTLCAALVLGSGFSTSSAAVTLFSENFNGYTSFPNQAPLLDFINAGLPLSSEGAQGIWYGARFEDPDLGSGSAASIASDLAVQRFGDASGLACFSGNCTPTGRVEDDAGLLFKVNTTNMTGITLDFDWRTFSTSTNDKVVVGYRVGSIAEFGTCTGAGEAGCFADLRTGTNSWSAGWTELMRDGSQGTFTHETFVLTGADNASEVWVALWLDNGEGDYAKFDNIALTGTISNPVPEAETYAMMLAGLGLVGLMARRRQA